MVQVVHEIMHDLKMGQYTIKLNHRLLLDATMRVSCPATICLGYQLNPVQAQQRTSSCRSHHLQPPLVAIQ